MGERGGRTWNRGARAKVLVLPALIALAAAACSGGDEIGGNGGTGKTGPVITSVAGAGEDAGQEGDGIAAIDAALYGPGAVVVDPEGNLYYSDEFGDGVTQRIRVVDPSGTVTTVAGNGTGDCSVDGTALEASIPGPHGLAIGLDGNLHFVSVFCFAVFRLEADGTLTTIAGQPGVQSSFGDGGPAAEAGFGGEPSQIAFDAQGNLYVTDFVANQVRKIDTEGIITTIAGTGEVGSSGDGGPATEATLNGPDGLAIDAEGNVYVTEYIGHRIRKIDTEGIITTVAGTGEHGFSGDGGPATEAQLYSPHDIEFDAEGNLYIAEEVNNRIRMIDAEGVISTVVGTGEAGFSGDGGAAVIGQLHGPNSIAFDAAGNLYIADTTNDRIRMVAFT